MAPASSRSAPRQAARDDPAGSDRREIGGREALGLADGAPRWRGSGGRRPGRPRTIRRRIMLARTAEATRRLARTPRPRGEDQGQEGRAPAPVWTLPPSAIVLPRAARRAGEVPSVVRLPIAALLVGFAWGRRRRPSQEPCRRAPSRRRPTSTSIPSRRAIRSSRCPDRSSPIPAAGRSCSGSTGSAIRGACGRAGPSTSPSICCGRVPASAEVVWVRGSPRGPARRRHHHDGARRRHAERRRPRDDADWRGDRTPPHHGRDPDDR